jgi:DedD protein
MLKSRSGSQGSSSNTPPQTIEVVRRRARHRLIGAAILVLVGVLGFPLLFDTEPRPVAGDIPIEIPSRGDTTALTKAESDASSSGAVTALEKAEASEASTVPARDSLDAREEVVESTPANAAAKAVPAPVVPPSPVERNVVKDSDSDNKAKVAREAKLEAATATAAAKRDAAESARAKALLESKKPSGGERFVVQVGAFAEAASARATRLKLERAGMTTYTHVAETSAGKLIRVRVGPFTSRAEVDRAAAKVKALGLPARILTL